MYFASTVTFLWISYAWEAYLDYRQHKKLCEKERPTEIVSTLTQFTRLHMHPCRHESRKYIPHILCLQSDTGILILFLSQTSFVDQDKFSKAQVPILFPFLSNPLNLQIIFQPIQAIYKTMLVWSCMYMCTN